MGASEESTAMHGVDAYAPLLDSLPKGAKVAVVSMLGSLCPITLGHVQCYIEARRILLDDMRTGMRRPARLEHFDEFVGFVWLNGDHHVMHKVEEKGQKPLNYKDRAHLVQLATAELPWLCFDEGRGERILREKWPSLDFICFDMNGADDVVKYQKWQWARQDSRMITIGRPGSTAYVVEGMRTCEIDPDDGYFILGPDLPDISSTAARDSSMRGDQTALISMLHPCVADWLLRNDGHPGLAAGSSRDDGHNDHGGLAAVTGSPHQVRSLHHSSSSRRAGLARPGGSAKSPSFRASAAALQTSAQKSSPAPRRQSDTGASPIPRASRAGSRGPRKSYPPVPVAL